MSELAPTGASASDPPTGGTGDTDLAQAILLDAPALAREATRTHLAAWPQMRERFGGAADVRCTEDGIFHLRHLSAALSTATPALFTGYVMWAASMFAHLRIGTDDLHGTCSPSLTCSTGGTELTLNRPVPSSPRP